MNQPSEDPIRELKERQVEFEKRLVNVERFISPIKFTQLEIDSGSVHRRIDEIQKNTNITKILVEGVSGDLLQIKESQADLRDRLITHGEDLKAIKEKQDTHDELLAQLIGIGEKHTKTLENVATKDDISALKTTQERQERLLQAILSRLPEKP